MSLKAFHIVFICASVMLSLTVAAWGWSNYREGGSPTDLAWSLGACICGGLLLGYGQYFLKKFRKISYL